MKLLIVFLLGIMSILFFLGTVVFSQESQEKFSIPVVFEYPGVDERDPFYPLIYEEETIEVVEKKPLPVITQSDYELLGIAWEAKKSMAFIAKGGKTWMVAEGMSIDELKVLSIQAKEGKVTLIGEDMIIKLKMFKELGEAK